MQENQSTLYLTQGSGNSFKPALVAHCLQIACEKKYIDVLSGDTRKPEFLSINPLGVVPYLKLNDDIGIGESNAIAWYMAEGSSLMPDTALERAQTIRWMNYEQTALECNISPIRFFTAIAPNLKEEHEDMFPQWRDGGNAGLHVLDKHLEKNDFITDYGYSVADIAVFGYTHLANEGGFDLGGYKAVSKWIERVENQNGYLPINELLDGISGSSYSAAA